MSVKFGLLEIPRKISDVLKHAQLAEELGFDWLGVADSQSLYREVFSTLGMIGHVTDKLLIGPTVTNGLTRHPAVMASAIATVHEISQGRAILGIGTGDSAIFNINQRPHGLKGLREYVLAVRELLSGVETKFNGRTIHTSWTTGQKNNPVPIYIAAEGPKTLELAGEIADGVICGMGLTPIVVEATLKHIEIGAERAARRLEDLDLWAFAKVNVGEDQTNLIQEIRMELCSTCHHAFQFTLEGKHVPPELSEAIAYVQENYDPAQHLALGESPNAQLIEDPTLLAYLADRFAVVGNPDDCIRKIKQIRNSGIERIIFTGNITSRSSLIRKLGTSVLPYCRD